MQVVPRDVGHIWAHICLVYILIGGEGLTVGDKSLLRGVIFRLKYGCELLLDLILVLFPGNVLKLLAALPKGGDTLDYRDQNEGNTH